MTWRIPLSDVRVSAAQHTAVQEVLASGWLSMGPRVATFEEAFAADAKVPHAVAVSNGTAALILALQAVGVGPGDEVVMPSFTFVACASAVTVLGATPVFADICAPERPLVDPHDVLDAVTERTRAVLVVHYGGALVDMDALVPLRERGIALVEDAAHAAGPLSDDGSWMPLRGDAAAYSFFANKNLALGEGGMVSCGEATVAERVRLLRAHGMTAGTWDRHSGRATDYDVTTIGWNFRLTEMQAAMGTSALVDLPSGNAARRRLLACYADELTGSPIHLAFERQMRTAGHLAVAALPKPGMRSAVRDALASRGIQSSFHYPPIHRFKAYADRPSRPLPRTDDAAGRLVTVPLHPYLTVEEVQEICSTVRTVVGSV